MPPLILSIAEKSSEALVFALWSCAAEQPWYIVELGPAPEQRRRRDFRCPTPV